VQGDTFREAGVEDGACLVVEMTVSKQKEDVINMLRDASPPGTPDWQLEERAVHYMPMMEMVAELAFYDGEQSPLNVDKFNKKANLAESSV